MASPTISTAVPTSGIVANSVTINGSGFGATQGTGQVWIGTAEGVVQSWSATQIVAQVAAGSKSGVVQVLNIGSASGTVAFTVNALNLVRTDVDDGLHRIRRRTSGRYEGITTQWGATNLDQRPTDWTDRRRRGRLRA